MTRRTLRYLASHPAGFAAMEAAHDDRLLNDHLDEPDIEPLEDAADDVCPCCVGAGVTGSHGYCVICEGTGVGRVPKQEFHVGERVVAHGYMGTVAGYVPQVHTDNLYRVLWDDDPSDRDLYSARGLSRATERRAA